MGQVRCLPQPEQLHGLRARTEQGRELDDGTVISLSRGSMFTKDKVDVCIRSLLLRRTFASTAEGRRELASWLRRNKVDETVMEASGG